MARVTFKVTRGQQIGEGMFSTSAGQGGAPTVDVSTALADNVLTDDAITAMGALSGYDALVGAADALSAAHAAAAQVATDLGAVAPTVSGDFIVSIDNATITSLTQMKRCFDAALQVAAGSGKFTP